MGKDTAPGNRRGLKLLSHNGDACNSGNGNGEWCWQCRSDGTGYYLGFWYVGNQTGSITTNGGDLAFGNDGYLYVSSGDGSSDSDANLTEVNMAQILHDGDQINVPAIDPNAKPIDLPSSLKLAGVDNPEILLAQQRVLEAVALRQLAAVQILPNINAGSNFD